ncbi:helix-turn-helix domain-containing protein [Dysgonomonas sp. HGC4]|uniref:helix-turn-helix domain-containing protein n=1 Tax=Dysgonomonas sp. HGC4 TaxID=1658009 RepID=UPI00067F944C|nr:helix-turn-helix domain-containing protein [Dysgonomonas sp. HGC4]MBD8348565.1 hypothetical protein [Dysgonomonas sp. HGC4]
MITEFSKIVGIPESEILSNRRTKEIVNARQIYWLILYKSGYSYTAIARLNNKYHSSVLTSIGRIKGLLEIKDFDVTDIYNRTKHLIQSSMSIANSTITLTRPSLFNAEGKAHEEFIFDHFDCPRCNGLGYIHVGSYNDIEDKDSTCPICRGTKKIKAIVNIDWSASEIKKAP